MRALLQNTALFLWGAFVHTQTRAVSLFYAHTHTRTHIHTHTHTHTHMLSLSLPPSLPLAVLCRGGSDAKKCYPPHSFFLSPSLPL